METVKIPQNIQIEDKLLGPLSIRQIVIIGIGLGTTYTLVAMVKKAYGAIPVMAHTYVWLPAIVAVAFAMVRINDISLFRYFLLMAEMMAKPRRRTWQPRQGLIINVMTRAALERGEKARVKAAQMKSGAAEREEASPLRLQDISVLLDREGRVQKPPAVRRVDTVFDDGADGDPLLGLDDTAVAAEKQRIDRAWATMRRGSGVTADPLHAGFDDIRPPPAP